MIKIHTNKLTRYNHSFSSGMSMYSTPYRTHASKSYWGKIKCDTIYRDYWTLKYFNITMVVKRND